MIKETAASNMYPKNLLDNKKTKKKFWLRINGYYNFRNENGAPQFFSFLIITLHTDLKKDVRGNRY